MITDPLMTWLLELQIEALSSISLYHFKDGQNASGTEVGQANKDKPTLGTRIV